VLSVVLIGGCTTARSNLGTSDSSCYLALPTLTKAVHGHGRLLGVHRYTWTVLRKQVPKLVGQLPVKERGSTAMCVAAYTGQFTQGTVSDPHGESSGRLAVVVSTATGNHLLGTVIFTKAPLRFSHPHVG
jgi:hypothetical protein